MKKYFLAAILAVATAATAHAQAAKPAAAPAKPAAPAAPVLPWNGGYAGLQAGWGFGNETFDFSGANGLGSSSTTPKITAPVTGDITNRINGFVGGAQIGADHEVGAFVYGAGFGINYTNLKGSSACPSSLDSGAPASSTPETCNTNIAWLGTFTGRIGISHGNALIYARGGYAAADTWLSTINDASGNEDRRQKQMMGGWTAGGGIEAFVHGRTGVFVEYDYYDVRGQSENTTSSTGVAQTTFADPSAKFSTVMFGVNFHTLP